MPNEKNSLDSVTEKLIAKLERAIEELDSRVVTVKTKTKRVEYDEDGKKPLEEITSEREEISIEKALIDPAALKQLASAVKELRGNDDPRDSSVTVLLSPEAKEYSV